MSQEEVGAVEEDFRALARIVTIDDIQVHPHADKLELAIIGGWQVCCKIGEFKKGDLALYCEIDSLVPTARSEFTFLEARTADMKSVDDVSYARIKTIKIRKELSQGLLVPVPAEFRKKPTGTVLTKELGILKYEKPTKGQGPGQTYSLKRKTHNFIGRIGQWIYGEAPASLLKEWPEFLSKSEEPRVQNIGGQYAAAVSNGEKFEESVKLDGSSMTVYCVPDPHEDKMDIRTGVCSRNFEIGQEDIHIGLWAALRHWLGGLFLRNQRCIVMRPIVWPEKGQGMKAWLKDFWLANHDAVKNYFSLPTFRRVVRAADDQFLGFALRHQLLDKLHAHATRLGHPLDCLTLQGELVGPDIQENFEGVEKERFLVYRVYREGYAACTPEEARSVCNKLGLEYVPVLSLVTTLPPTLKDALKRADGPRALAKGGYREGVVYKSLERDFSFKCISNKYLEKEA